MEKSILRIDSFITRGSILPINDNFYKFHLLQVYEPMQSQRRYSYCSVASRLYVEGVETFKSLFAIKYGKLQKYDKTAKMEMLRFYNFQ